MRVLISAGEASGDAYGARIVASLRAAGVLSNEVFARDLVKDLMQDSKGVLARAHRDLVQVYGAPLATFHPRTEQELSNALVAAINDGTVDIQRIESEALAAIGGRKLKAAGAGVVSDSSTWGAVGIIESLFVAPRVFEGYQSAMSLLKSSGPGLFIPIDFGYLNIKLARQAKRLGWKVLYFVPPGSWRRTKQGSDLPNITDAIVTPFSWSADILRSMGANAHFFGHPLKEMVAESDYQGPRDAVAVLPGSRLHEVSRNMDVIAEAVRGLDVRLRFAVASSLDVAEVERRWEDLGGPEAEFMTDTYQVLKSSTAAIVCSGTATLEAALCGCPMVVVYRTSLLMELEFRIRRPKFDYISLPNILLQRLVVPELIQYDASPERIRHELTGLLEDSLVRDAQLAAFQELDKELGSGRCFEQTAQLALSLTMGENGALQ